MKRKKMEVDWNDPESVRRLEEDEVRRHSWRWEREPKELPQRYLSVTSLDDFLGEAGWDKLNP
jgi:hypothetical protein